ncbi:MAG: polyphosphate kinase 1 [Oscillatoriales cyanobacterium]|uniref:polyphosphate kinase 1 n=1 Tax=Microcoleus anatoxicus TaxID=2705319 RepID=UPI002970DE1E|nr:MAG: polyphosphate kinase 1 [Oscillatoriales cyanobacterium]TAD97705.1 MAG: polyphosphate kinase 1 [Oscillatoriales cyanobacterium]TAE06769.1 MAG: polyphosphate kinase 1 [Oscillatoriales cyanobacterium]TAF05674.1 MAG: polyphosphate kinase 1 [Oscillatoriales cyanobacterium]TAF65042.1 MAG: polyphosphate kinase 1 [Oscillatoriales cyanobacterium]
MSKQKKTSTKNYTEINLSDPQYYFNREQSWLEFNNRVLHEALDPRTPLLERLKFLAIFSSNLDEYFMVRVAALKQQVEAKVTKLTSDGSTPQQQLDAISKRLLPMVSQQHSYFEQTLRPKLAASGIHILDYIDLNQEQRTYLHRYFKEQVFPVLTPLAVDPSHPFPFLSNLSLNLAVVVRDPDTQEELFARVKVPQVLPRFLPLPADLQWQQRGKSAVWTGVPLEQVIAHNLEALFPGMDIQEYHPFRITRNADLTVEEDEAEDLLLAIEQELRKRRFGGSAVRLEIQAIMPPALRDMLMDELDLGEQDVYVVEGLLGLKDLMYFVGLHVPELKDPPWTPVVPVRLRNPEVARIDESISHSEEMEDIFMAIRRGDIMLHHPYHSFAATVQRFITEAARDRSVLAIKMTLYRTSGDSPIVSALIEAAQNGKQVAVLVELKARFDEENNINWARKLEQAGVHVVYGLVGLKTHTKILMAVRREDGCIRRYVHIGTGNYNPKTAGLYTDVGLLSCREDLGSDLTDLFNYLTGYSRQVSYRNLLVAPVNMRDRFLALIRREAEFCRLQTENSNSTCGRIVAKMNALVDPQIIVALYEASQAGVKIDLIIRGICCLRPGVEGVSENIKVISIIGRFLEHSRMFYFFNGGNEEVYIGSADWMQRNLTRRVEAIVQVEDPTIAMELQEILGVMLADNRQAWDLQPGGHYSQRRPPVNCPEVSSQQILMDMVMN